MFPRRNHNGSSRRVFPVSTTPNDEEVPFLSHRVIDPPPKTPLTGSSRGTLISSIGVTKGSGRLIGTRPDEPVLSSYERMLQLRNMTVTSTGGSTPPPTTQHRPIVHAMVEVEESLPNPRERRLADARRHLELQLMEAEDYTGKPEGHARLQRQAEREKMQQEELQMLRYLQAEQAQLRAQVAAKRAEEEQRIQEEYRQKYKAEREKQQAINKAKEEQRKQQLENQMKLLKEAADAKAQAAYHEQQERDACAARLLREQHQSELEISQMQVEDVVGMAFRHEYMLEQARLAAIEQEANEWRLFEEEQAKKQEEETRKRRAQQAQEYEREKARRMQIQQLASTAAAAAAAYERKKKQEQISSTSAEGGNRSVSISVEPEHNMVDVVDVCDLQASEIVPFAQVLSVTPDSPAHQAGLRPDDLIVLFGGISSTTPQCLIAIASFIQSHVNQRIELVVLRSIDAAQNEGIRQNQMKKIQITLIPCKWIGKGLLGCQLGPFKWTNSDAIDSPNTSCCSSVDQVTIPPQIPEPQTPTPELTMSTTMASPESTVQNDVLVVSSVEHDSLAFRLGIKEGDVISSCGDLDITPSSPLQPVEKLTRVAEYLDTTRRQAQQDVFVILERWDSIQQQYNSLSIVIPHGDIDLPLVPLGCSLMLSSQYYRIPSSTATVCEACYYTTLASAAHAAVLQGHISCLEVLLESYGAQLLDWRDDQSRTPLFYACYAAQIECVKLLLTHTTQSYDVEQDADIYGDSPLHAAVATDSTDLVHYLLDYLLSRNLLHDVNLLNRQTQTACVHIASSVSMLQLLYETYHADILVLDKEGRMPLFHACLRGDIDSVVYLSTAEPDFVDYADATGNTPLHMAAWAGLEAIVKVLLQYVPNIALYVPNGDGKNTLELAQESQCESVILLLQQYQSKNQG